MPGFDSVSALLNRAALIARFELSVLAGIRLCVSSFESGCTHCVLLAVCSCRGSTLCQLFCIGLHSLRGLNRLFLPGFDSVSALLNRAALIARFDPSALAGIRLCVSSFESGCTHCVLLAVCSSRDSTLCQLF